MTYPPQQPGQFNQSSYQGLGSYSGGQGGPGNKNTGKIVAIVIIALLVLGGGGVATYFLTKGGDEPKNDVSSDQSNRGDSRDTGSDESPSDDASPDRDAEDESDSSNTPDDVRDDYMAAYENKDFADVVDNACRAYKTKFGTDTSELEDQLADYDISASPDGEVEIDDQHPDSATAKIDLTLVGDGQTQEPKILIKIVQESGQWRFCGEGTA